MGAIFDRARMQIAGLVPISFDTPPPDASCAGKWRLNGITPLGICVRCARHGKDGIEPAARIVAGSAECLNFRDAR